MKIVFDTNILARAHQKATGLARGVLLRAAAGPDTLITSSYILAELERVLTYPRLLKRSGLGPTDIAEYLENLSAISHLVEPIAVPSDLLRDPNDEAILGTALAARADILCTLDAHLREEGVRIFASISGTQIVTDFELLNLF